MNSPSTRVAKRLLAPAIGLAMGFAVLSAPLSAQAGFTQYALHYQTPESTARYSAVATVTGGKAYADSGIMRTYIQTVSGGVLLASAYSASGQTVNMTHPPYNGAQSRCYWDYVGGTVPGGGTVGLNCWRLS